MVGRARLRTVRSSPTTSMLAAIAISAHQRRATCEVMTVTIFRLVTIKWKLLSKDSHYDESVNHTSGWETALAGRQNAEQAGHALWRGATGRSG